MYSIQIYIYIQHTTSSSPRPLQGGGEEDVEIALSMCPSQKFTLLFPELAFYFPELYSYFPEVPFCFLEFPFCFPEVPSFSVSFILEREAKSPFSSLLN